MNSRFVEWYWSVCIFQKFKNLKIIIQNLSKFVKIFKFFPISWNFVKFFKISINFEFIVNSPNQVQPNIYEFLKILPACFPSFILTKTSLQIHSNFPFWKIDILMFLFFGVNESENRCVKVLNMRKVVCRPTLPWEQSLRCSTFITFTSSLWMLPNKFFSFLFFGAD